MLMINDFFDALRSSGLLGPLITATIAIIIALYFQWWRNRKRLQICLANSIPLKSITSNVPNAVNITVNNQPIENIQLVNMLVANRGSVSVTSEDIIQPFCFTFAGDTQILSCEIAKRSPEYLPVEFETTENVMKVLPLLLNSGDEFMLQLLVKDYLHPPLLTVRIKGISRVVLEDFSTTVTPEILIIVIQWLLVSLSGLIFLYKWFLFFITVENAELKWSSLFLCVILAILITLNGYMVISGIKTGFKSIFRF
jgi:hypothetical protein